MTPTNGKGIVNNMTLNNKIYGKLLTDVLPRKIETEEENERILGIIKNLMRKGEDKLSPEEETLFVLLAELVEEFEEKAYPMPDIKPNERIKYLLEEKRLKQKDLVILFGSEGVTSEILNGKREITLKTARKLSEFFNVPVELFV